MSPHPSRPLAVALLTTGLVVLGGGAASAHVSVSSTDASPGGYGKVTFRVPNESDAASTVSLRVQLPTDTPLTSVRAQPVPGWTVSLTDTRLDPPVTVGGEQVTEVVSVVEFRAAPGGGIAPGQFQEFALSGGPFPDVETLTFNAVQVYSDGSEAAWIEPTVAGRPEPERPAPVLSLTGDAGTAATGGHDTGTTPDAGPTATDAGPTDADAHDGGSTGLAVTALVLGALGLVAGLAGLGLGLAARRRTVSG